MAKFLGLSSELQKEDTPASGTFTKVANAISISGPTAESSDIDVSSLDSTGGYREYLPGFKDPGEVTVPFQYDPSTTDVDPDDLLTAFNARSVLLWNIVLDPTGENKVIAFDGYIKAFPFDAQAEEAVRIDMVIRVTGAFTIT